MKKTTLIIASVIFAFAIIISLINASKEKEVEVKGTIKSVSEGGADDLVFELEGDKITYYINNGLNSEAGFTLQKAKTDFIGKTTTIHYIKSWTILAPFGKTSECIREISIDGIMLYGSSGK